MPIHDWTRVDAGLFHAFHQDWIGVLARALNAGVLPPDYFALREQSDGTFRMIGPCYILGLMFGESVKADVVFQDIVLV